MSLPKFTTTHHTSTYPSISPLLPELSTAGNTVLITGGGSGLGPTIAHSFASSGSTQIVLLGRTRASLTSTASSLEAEFPKLKVLPLVADIVDEAAIKQAFEEAVKKFGGIDILVSNAGYMSDPASLATGSIDQWWKAMEINVKGNLILSRAFLASPSAGEKVFLHLTTFAIHLPAMPGGLSSYVVSKLTAAKMMEYLQAENADLRVMIVHPGVLLTTAMGQKAVDAGISLPGDDMDLAGDFIVWAASSQAEWLRGKFLWSNWDVDELKARKEEILAGGKLTLGLNGWPSA